MKPVAFVTPTMNRPERHEALYQTFVAQSVRPKHLYILDESLTPSPFFSKHRADTTYVHAPGKPRIDGVTRIGEARNRLVWMVREPFCCQLDDDDLYDPNFADHLAARIGDAAAVKLDVFQCLSSDGKTLYEWDTRKFGGNHYVLHGDDPVQRIAASPDELPTQMRESFRFGYGFALGYRTEVARKHPFPTEGTEDIAFVRGLLQAGQKVEFVSDAPWLATHVTHAGSNDTSVYPQKKLRMVAGIGDGMTELPQGQPVNIEPNTKYTILAAVAKKHSLRSILVRLSGWGVKVHEAQDDPQDEYATHHRGPYGSMAGLEDGYRLVSITGSSSTPATIPWQTPSIMRWIDKSRIVRAWKAGPRMVGGLPPRIVARVRLGS